MYPCTHSKSQYQTYSNLWDFLYSKFETSLKIIFLPRRKLKWVKIPSLFNEFISQSKNIKIIWAQPNHRHLRFTIHKYTIDFTKSTREEIHNFIKLIPVINNLLNEREVCTEKYRTYNLGKTLETIPANITKLLNIDKTNFVSPSPPSSMLWTTPKQLLVIYHDTSSTLSCGSGGLRMATWFNRSLS